MKMNKYRWRKKQTHTNQTNLVMISTNLHGKTKLFKLIKLMIILKSVIFSLQKNLWSVKKSKRGIKTMMKEKKKMAKIFKFFAKFSFSKITMNSNLSLKFIQMPISWITM